MEIKKKRGSNFSTAEINLLMSCLIPEINIIENKHTDGVTMQEKKHVWQKLTAAFNSAHNDIHRDMNSIKMKYNIKKTLKKKITENKQNYKGTGGGPPVDTKLLWYEEQLYSILQLGIDGLASAGDSDIICQVPDVSPVDHTYNYSTNNDENICLINDNENEVILFVYFLPALYQFTT